MQYPQQQHVNIIKMNNMRAIPQPIAIHHKPISFASELAVIGTQHAAPGVVGYVLLQHF
jgi:hypothetical protein